MQRDKLRVVMLVGPGASSRIMYHALRDDFDIQRIILERKVSASTMIRRRVKRLGLTRTFGQLLFIVVNRFLSRLSKSRIRQLMTRYGLNDDGFPPDVLQEVESVNDSDVITMLQAASPDAVIVNGTRILSKKIIASIDAPFLNTHMGITPRYRGVHGGYWALASGDRQHCGVTVHLIDEGIDTGGVLYQEIIEVERSDNFNTYPLHQIAKGIPLMKAALQDVAANRIKPKQGVGPSQLWYHPTLMGYLKNAIIRFVR